MKAKRIIASEEVSLRSQFFQSLRHFSNQEMLRSTTHRFGITAKVCHRGKGLGQKETIHERITGSIPCAKTIIDQFIENFFVTWSDLG